MVESFLDQIGFPGTESVGQSALPDGLSAREVEVLRLLAAGKGNQQIADELVISLNTARKHVANILDKTGTANRAQAAVYAKDHGLV
jgi:DNA-binding NarL/FixJ family response regulator